jgi:histidinol-phosphate aminotransferase
MNTAMSDMVRLNANENFYGCSPRAFQLLGEGMLQMKVHEYPGYPSLLEEKLAQKFRVGVKNIVIGAGSVRLIDGIVQTLVEADEEIIIFERSFIAYEQIVHAHRRKLVFAPQVHFTCEVQSVIPLINQKTKAIFIANPNNPTGTIITHLDLENLLKTVTENILVVIDEAYGEYVTDIFFPDSVSLQQKYPNLIILRSFSKIFGLAGLRVGYAIVNEQLAVALKKNRIPFFLNCFAEGAAIAALDDELFISDCIQKNKEQREFLFQNISKLGMKVIPTQANFLFVYFDDEEEKERLFKMLSKEKLLTCNLSIFGQDKSLRIGIGDDTVNKKIVDLISAFTRA